MALKIKTREEAIAVLRDMKRRKTEMEKQVQEEFAKARKEAENCYAPFNLTRLNMYLISSYLIIYDVHHLIN